MSEDMNLSVNGQSQVPPGFRFHPTEEELLQYYLRKKVAYQKIDLDVIRDVDLNKLEPWDIQEKCKIGSTQSDWYFFSHKDKKYPTGTRTNRATAAGFWKATGRDKVIYSSLRRIGMRKTLVFYRGRAPHGQKSDWIMHEYRLDDNTHDSNNASSSIISDSGPEEGWVVCRVFKKKNYHKSLDSPLTSSTSSIFSRTVQRNDNVMDQILTYMGRPSCSKQENESNGYENTDFTPSHHIPAPGDFLHLPGLMENPSSPLDENCGFKSTVHDLFAQTGLSSTNPVHGTSDWVALDRLVASQLNGHSSNNQVSNYGEDFCFSFDHEELKLDNVENSDRQNHQVSNPDTDFWTFARTSSSSSPSDPLCHLSV